MEAFPGNLRLGMLVSEQEPRLKNEIERQSTRLDGVFRLDMIMQCR
jgi:hypothetical protein